MIWVFLAGAILAEVAATLSLRMAAVRTTRQSKGAARPGGGEQGGGKAIWLVVMAVGYLAAFVFLTLALNGGVALGVAYGIWAASGVALTALASRLLFHEPLTKVMSLGIALIVAGVLLVELGAAH